MKNKTGECLSDSIWINAIWSFHCSHEHIWLMRRSMTYPSVYMTNPSNLLTKCWGQVLLGKLFANFPAHSFHCIFMSGVKNYVHLKQLFVWKTQHKFDIIPDFLEKKQSECLKDYTLQLKIGY